jgi:hypothetical protein
MERIGIIELADGHGGLSPESEHPGNLYAQNVARRKEPAAWLARWHTDVTMSTIGAKSLSQIDFALRDVG